MSLWVTGESPFSSSSDWFLIHSVHLYYTPAMLAACELVTSNGKYRRFEVRRAEPGETRPFWLVAMWCEKSSWDTADEAIRYEENKGVIYASSIPANQAGPGAAAEREGVLLQPQRPKVRTGRLLHVHLDQPN